jgi:hypothetical protein
LRGCRIGFTLPETSSAKGAEVWKNFSFFPKDRRKVRQMQAKRFRWFSPLRQTPSERGMKENE